MAISEAIRQLGKAYPQEVRMLRASTTRRLELKPNQYEFNPRGKLVWLQRLCFWVLDRLHCQARDYVETVTYAPLQGKDIQELVLNSIRTVKHDVNPDIANDLVVCIGTKEWCELMNLNHIARYFGSFYYNTGPYGYYDGWSRQNSPFGIQVAVIPWMSGVVVVPRDAVANVVK